VSRRYLPLLLLLPALGGCNLLFKSPSKANIELRKQNQQLEGQIAQLKLQHDADAATITGLTQRTGTVPALDPGKPGHEGLKVYVGLLDQYGDEIKSAGSFVVEAFDLGAPQATRVARCEFPVEQAQQNWHSFLTRYEYVLTCPWETPPRHPDVTVRVQFTDELTGRQFTAQSVVKVEVPPTQPATRPAQASASPR
jgi:hypothetical protein